MMQGIADIVRAQQLGVANAEEVRHYIGFAQRVRPAARLVQEGVRHGALGAFHAPVRHALR